MGQIKVRGKMQRVAVINDGAPVPVGGTVKYEAGKEVKTRLVGANFGDATVIKVGNTVVEPSALNETKMIRPLRRSPSSIAVVMMTATTASTRTSQTLGDVCGITILHVTQKKESSTMLLIELFAEREGWSPLYHNTSQHAVTLYYYNVPTSLLLHIIPYYFVQIWV